MDTLPNETYSIDYPRRVWQRRGLRWLGRGLLPLLTRTQVVGRKNFPEHGPLIVVGNHIAAMEVVLMVTHAPWQMEMLGPGDILPPPAMDAIAKAHGYIPINRGNIDRTALNQAMDVLRQGGILGMFPEGGIWDPGNKPAKSGVSWLSYHTGAPILPIGFGGLEGAMGDIFKLKRPKLWMNVGEVIPPVQVADRVSRKVVFQDVADDVMRKVDSLIPEEFKPHIPQIHNERFELRLFAYHVDGTEIAIPDVMCVTSCDALCKIFYRPAILNIFRKDLGYPVEPLQDLDSLPPAAALVTAVRSMLDYVRHDNPAFFIYRFGLAEGSAMTASLEDLLKVLQWAADHGYTMRVQPTRRYQREGSDEDILEMSPGEAHTW